MNSFCLKLSYPFSLIKYSLHIVYEQLPSVIRFSFDSLDEIYEALVLHKNHKIGQDGVIGLRVEITKKGETIEKWINLNLQKIEEEEEEEE